MLCPPPIAEIHGDNYRFLQQFVYAQSGIVLEADKHYLFESRLAPIVRELSLGSINDLCRLLRSTLSMDVSRQVVEAMTTNETYFFRDPAHYDAIRTILLPKLKESRRESKKLRFWSAAASTGQEAYSLGILLLEEGLRDWNIQILGTDFNSQVLSRASSGLYKQVEVNRGLATSLLVKYFGRSGMDWQVNEALRQMAHFETIDLRQSMRSRGPFDLVFCRNVMIYFDAATKRQILKELHGTLYKGAWLLLGAVESALGVEEWFDRESVGNTTVYVAR